MISERDFVLNNYCTYYNQSEIIKFKDEFIISELKKIYKNICENTSEEGDLKIDDILNELNIMNTENCFSYDVYSRLHQLISNLPCEDN